jgi:hypothetical protein
MHECPAPDKPRELTSRANIASAKALPVDLNQAAVEKQFACRTCIVLFAVPTAGSASAPSLASGEDVITTDYAQAACGSVRTRSLKRSHSVAVQISVWA